MYIQITHAFCIYAYAFTYIFVILTPYSALAHSYIHSSYTCVALIHTTRSKHYLSQTQETLVKIQMNTVSDKSNYNLLQHNRFNKLINNIINNFSGA